ncbi:MAG: DUF3047 domain-containing protein [Proteobacteria bacterium]|nr:DUF3047 domain-containing protein [Pseudomonadota bacterium]
MLLNPALPLLDVWEHRAFGKVTEYTNVVLDDGRSAIAAIGRDSASGLYRRVNINIDKHPWISWAWRVDALQASADIREKALQDYAAAIFLIFGAPSLLRPDVPTLVYAWTNDKVREGSIIASPHHSGSVKVMVVKSGAGSSATWLENRRNIVDDFRAAFGTNPPDTLEMIALWTDNDQTHEPVKAFYGSIVVQPD